MKFNAHQATRQIIELIQEAKSTYEQLEADEQRYTDESNDLNHALELLPLTPEQRRDYGEQLGECRWKRRQAKDAMEQLEPLVSYLKLQRSLIGGLNQVYQDINTAVQEQSKRYYRVRVRKDLGEVFEHRAKEKAAPKAAGVSVRRDRRVRCRLI
jgi:septation ring formation regulator EzrA